ncbi:DUF3630 family protein [Saccharobesus litoralis]|uniref:DUF3630 family protein n=1 Tax=Saccharobesus litoralis TaxID=2172099 RepID=UPI00131F1160|nr:DUF3630 family protein [Saccharobesus litoralis]
MQPLNIQAYSSQESTNEYIIELQVTSPPDWDELQQPVEAFLIQNGFSIVEFMYGADRFTWRLDLAGLTAQFHVELLTTSFWFETDDKVTYNAIKLGL